MPAAGYHAEHEWVGAATVAIPARIVRQTLRRGSLELPERTWVKVVEVYCDVCRKPYDQAYDTKCHITPWLHGGPIGERKKRGRKPSEDGGARH